MARHQSTPVDDSQVQPNMARAPEGFRRMGSVTAECWFALEEGNSIRGKLLGIYDRADPRNKKTGRSEFYQVELSEPTLCRYGTGEKAEIKTAPAGTIVNLNCNTKTEVLKELIPDIVRGAEFEIHVFCGKKLELKNGNTMWNMVPSSKLLKGIKVADGPDFSGDGDGSGGTQDAA